MLLQPGNTKLGWQIQNFALPAVETCFPSEACLKECYGTKFRYRSEYVMNLYRRNWDATYEDDFADRMRAELIATKAAVCRIHTVGDFFEAEAPLPPDAYVNLIREIVVTSPRVYFYAYTRSWTHEPLRVALRRLSAEPNFQLWLSTDKTMKAPPKWKHVKRAYMSCSDDDVPRYKVDLVFRAGSKATPMKKDAAGNLVCPYEQGVKRKVSITCSTCGICFNHNPVVPLSMVGKRVAQTA